jgi:hypothetical protein
MPEASGIDVRFIHPRFGILPGSSCAIPLTASLSALLGFNHERIWSIRFDEQAQPVRSIPLGLQQIHFANS